MLSSYDFMFQKFSIFTDRIVEFCKSEIDIFQDLVILKSYQVHFGIWIFFDFF